MAKSYQSKENIIDELISNYSSKLDWGVSWIKFVAAVAPLLGLLGTVIGMIETFQAITLFGTGDPKQMAICFGSPVPNKVIAWKVSIIPITVPNRPNKGATAATNLIQLTPQSNLDE